MNVKNSSTITTPVIDKIEKFEDLLISGQAILMDETDNSLKKERVGFGTQNLLKQRRDPYGNGDFDEDPYDDNMYECQDLPQELQDICDNLDIRVRGLNRILQQVVSRAWFEVLEARLILGKVYCCWVLKQQGFLDDRIWAPCFGVQDLDNKGNSFKLGFLFGGSFPNQFQGDVSLGDLAAIDTIISDEDQSFLLLASLPSSNDNFVEALLYGRDTLKIEDGMPCTRDMQGSSIDERWVKFRIGQRQAMTRKTLKGRKQLGEYHTGWKIKTGNALDSYAYRYVRVFSWLASIEQGILEPVKVKCIFLGYHKSIVGNNLWRLDDVTLKVVLYRNIGFNESGEYKKTFISSGVATVAGNAVTTTMAITRSIHQATKGLLDRVKGNVRMEIVRDQSGNTLRVSQSRFYNKKLVQTLLEGSLSGDCDVEKNIIKNGNKALKKTVGTGEQTYKPTSAKEKLDRRNEIKARGTLLMALPNKDQLKFHSYQDAKLLIKAIEKRNKAELEIISLDDLYNNLKIYEPELSRSSNTNQNPQNMDFVSSNSISSTNEADTTASEVSIAHTQEDLEQINPNDLEEMDLHWEMAMLTIRARSYQAEEEISTNYAFMALTFSGSSSSSDSEVDSCSKSCMKAYANLKEEYDSLTSDYKKSQINLLSYKAGLQSVKERLVHYKENEAVLTDKINVLNLEVKLRDHVLAEYTKNLEKVKKEKDELKLTLENFQNSSNSLNNLLDSQVSDKSKAGLGYKEITPDSFVNSSEILEKQENRSNKPFTGNYMPLKRDLRLID
nr:zinc finger, CCHC-type [Tanacetum cinerariifolium]